MGGKIPNLVRLTACDYEKNGFVHLAIWRHASEASARSMIELVDELDDPEAEPDNATAAFAFILDLVSEDGDLHDTSSRMLSTQVAQRLAPAQVVAWLQERPEPDHVVSRAVPELTWAMSLDERPARQIA